MFDNKLCKPTCTSKINLPFRFVKKVELIESLKDNGTNLNPNPKWPYEKFILFWRNRSSIIRHLCITASKMAFEGLKNHHQNTTTLTIEKDVSFLIICQCLSSIFDWLPCPFPGMRVKSRNWRYYPVCALHVYQQKNVMSYEQVVSDNCFQTSMPIVLKNAYMIWTNQHLVPLIVATTDSTD